MTIADELLAQRQQAGDKRLSYYLELWRDMMRGRLGPSGYGSRASGVNGTGSRDFEMMCGSMDRQQAEVVDAAIDDLPFNERMAVWHVHLASVWTFREPIEVIYERACGMLKISLPKRNLPWD